MDDAIRNALKKKRKLQEEIARLDQFIMTYEELTGTKIDQNEWLSDPDSTSRNLSSTRSRVRIRRRPNSPARIADAAEKVIRETGTPIQRGELVEALERRGIAFQSEDKARYIGTILWRHRDRFENIEGDGYWVKSLGAPPTNDVEDRDPNN